MSNVILQYIQKEEELKKIKNLLQFHEERNGFMRQFLILFGLSLEDLEIFSIDDIGEENYTTIQALKNWHNNDFDEKSAIAIFSLLDVSFLSCKTFVSLDSNQKIKILAYMMNAFNKKTLLKERGRAFAMRKKDDCLYFLKHQALKELNEDELSKLLCMFKGSEWEKLILHAKNERLYKGKDWIGSEEIKKIKEIILQDSFVNPQEFSEEIFLRLEEFKKKIETNEGNEKRMYYNFNRQFVESKKENDILDTSANIPNEQSKKSEKINKESVESKIENDIRDTFVSILKDLYKDDTSWTREGTLADNRVDIKVEYRKDSSFQVRIECKKDGNKDIFKGIEQLIEKYMKNSSVFGIYLVFYFGKGKYDKEELQKLLEDEVRKYSDYANRIKILLIDFRFEAMKKIK